MYPTQPPHWALVGKRDEKQGWKKPLRVTRRCVTRAEPRQRQTLAPHPSCDRADAMHRRAMRDTYMNMFGVKFAGVLANTGPTTKNRNMDI